MSCRRIDCDAEAVLATREQDVSNLGLCLVHLGQAIGNAALKPPYKLEGKLDPYASTDVSPMALVTRTREAPTKKTKAKSAASR